MPGASGRRAAISNQMVIALALATGQLVPEIVAQEVGGNRVTPEQIANSYRLIAESHAVRDRDPGLALLLGIAGYRASASRLARESLARALMATSEERTFLVSPRGVNTATLATDGKRLLATSNDGWLAIFDTRTGKLLAERVGAKGRLGRVPATESATFLPDQKRVLLTLSNGFARIWNPSTGNEVELQHAKGKHTTVDRVAAVGAGGTRAIVGVRAFNGGSRFDKQGFVFDIASGEELARFPGVEPVLCGDGSRFAAVDYSAKLVRVYDCATPTAAIELATPATPSGVRLSTTGDVAFVNARKAIHVFDVGSRQLRHRFDHANYIAHFEAVTDHNGGGRLAIGDRSRRIEIHDLGNRSHVGTVDLGGPALARLAFSPDGSLLACGAADGRIELVRARDASTVASLRGHELPITDLQFDAGGQRLVSSSEDGTVRIWRVDDTRSVVQLADYVRGSTGKTVIDPDRGLLAYAGSYRGGIPIWDLSTGEKLAHLDADHPATPHFLANDGTLLLRDSESTWLWRQGAANSTVPLGEQTKHGAFAVARSGKRYAHANDKTIRIFDLTDNGVAPPREIAQQVQGVGFSATGDHLFAAGWRPRSLTCYDTADGTEVWRTELPRVTGKGGMISTAVGSSHAHVAVAIGPDPAIHVLDRQTGECTHTLRDHRDKLITDLQFSPDASRLVSVGGDWTVRLYDTRTWQQLAVTRRERAWSFESWWNHALIAFSPDGLYYATCFQQEPVVQVRSCRDGSLAFECREPRDGVQAIAFDSVSQFLFVATRSGIVYRYPAIPILHAKRQRPRDFLPVEFATHMLDEKDPNYATKAITYRLDHTMRHALAPAHELDLLWLALARDDLGRAAYGTARKLAQRVAKRAPDQARLPHVLALADHRCGDPQAAIKRLSAGTVMPPSRGDAALAGAILSLAHLAAGERPRAIEELDELREAAADLTRQGNAPLRTLVAELERITSAGR